MNETNLKELKSDLSEVEDEEDKSQLIKNLEKIRRTSKEIENNLKQSFLIKSFEKTIEEFSEISVGTYLIKENILYFKEIHQKPKELGKISNLINFKVENDYIRIVGDFPHLSIEGPEY